MYSQRSPFHVNEHEYKIEKKTNSETNLPCQSYGILDNQIIESDMPLGLTCHFVTTEL